MRRSRSCSGSCPDGVSVDRLIKLALKAYRPLRLRSRPWRPGVDVYGALLRALRGVASSGDVVVVSEKALAVAKGLVVDEGRVRAPRAARLLWKVWMRIVWGYLLSALCKLKAETVAWLRRYPEEDGARHKQLALRVGGVLEALKPSSEAGIDGSNLPGRLASLPLPRPEVEAEELRRRVREGLGVDLTVMVVDSDRLYLHRGLKVALTARRAPLERSIYMGVASYIVGRAFKRSFIPTATPIAIAGRRPPLYLALGLAELADRLRGCGAGRTVFEMAERLRVGLSEVTWSMLESIDHYPVVLFKRRAGPRP